MRVSVLSAAICLSLVGLSAGSEVEAAIRRSTHIPAQGLGPALQVLAKDHDFQVLYRTEIVGELRTGGAVGELTTDEALTQLLSGTGLGYRYLDEMTVTVFQMDAATPSPGGGRQESSPRSETTESKGSFWQRFRLAQADQRASSANSSVESSEASAPGNQQRIELEEIVVTGTHISDGEVISPVMTFTRADLERSGATSAEEFMATIPQNFGGGQSSDSAGKLSGLDLNLSYGTAVNLRGVGSSATLVLVDGRRLAAGGGAGEFTDISLIPLSSVERIEVLTDGASAIYGADAVGGVVNFIMRKDFSGAETKALYGNSTEGGGEQKQISQILGTQWGSGNIMLAYEHQEFEQLSTRDRKFSRDATGPRDGPYNLLPAKKLDSMFTYGQQEITENVSVSVNGLYSEREIDILDWDFSRSQEAMRTGSSEQYGGGLGLLMNLNSSWQLQLDSGWSRNDTDTKFIRNAGASVQTQEARFDMWSTEARFSGTALNLPAGSVKVAIGAGYRNEEYDYNTSGTLAANDSDTKSAFAEILVPVWDGGENGSGMLLSLAGRYEEYRSFGSTFNPKIGLRWTALQDLAFHATYGTSFKAPTLNQLSGYNTQSVLINLVDRSTGATVRSLGRAGNNPDLNEESATTYTAGIDLGPNLAAGFRVRLGYFRIDYDDRIGSVTANPTLQLNDAAYQDSVIRRGEISDEAFNALVADLLSGSNGRVVSCRTPLNPATGACAEAVTNINAILDKRLINMSSVNVSGIDFSLSRSFALGSVQVDSSLNAAYMIDFDQQLTPGSETTELVDTLYNPLDFKARGMLTLSRGSWSGTLAVNYADQYSNEGVFSRQTGLPLPLAEIDASTTLDLNMQYRVDRNVARTWLKGVSVSLNVTNALDADPPYIDDGFLGFGYDPANAEPLGRFVSMVFTKIW